MNVQFYNADLYNYNYISCFNNFKNEYVFVSKKVAFTSFCKLDCTKSRRVWQILDFNNSITRAIVRNPYRRIESLYKDKCLTCVDENIIQNTQSEIIKIFGKEKFFKKEISFEEFIDKLPQLINSECHFFPQTEYIPSFIKNIYKIENRESIKNIFSLFNSEEMREHKSIEMELKWTRNMRTVINQLYIEDFKKFEYYYE